MPSCAPTLARREAAGRRPRGAAHPVWRTQFGAARGARTASGLRRRRGPRQLAARRACADKKPRAPTVLKQKDKQKARKRGPRAATAPPLRARGHRATPRAPAGRRSNPPMTRPRPAPPPFRAFRVRRHHNPPPCSPGGGAAQRWRTPNRAHARLPRPPSPPFCRRPTHAVGCWREGAAILPAAAEASPRPGPTLPTQAHASVSTPGPRRPAGTLLPHAPPHVRTPPAARPYPPAPESQAPAVPCRTAALAPPAARTRAARAGGLAGRAPICTPPRAAALPIPPAMPQLPSLPTRAPGAPPRDARRRRGQLPAGRPCADRLKPYTSLAARPRCNRGGVPRPMAARNVARTHSDGRLGALGAGVCRGVGARAPAMARAPPRAACRPRREERRERPGRCAPVGMQCCTSLLILRAFSGESRRPRHAVYSAARA
jgi:hypothetical protein